MTDQYNEEAELEASGEQIEELRRLGVPETQLEGISVAEADALIAELRDERQAAGRFKVT